MCQVVVIAKIPYKISQIFPLDDLFVCVMCTTTAPMYIYRHALALERTYDRSHWNIYYGSMVAWHKSNICKQRVYWFDSGKDINMHDMIAMKKQFMEFQCILCY